MTATKLEETGVGLLFAERNEQLESLREDLLTFGRLLGIFDLPQFSEKWLCDCGADNCPWRAAEHFPAEQLMASLLTYWDPANYPQQQKADPNLEHADRFRHALITFGQAFGMFDCPCGDDNCRVTMGPQLKPYPLLELVWEIWVFRSGHYLRMPSLQETERVRLYKARNLQLIEEFTRRILKTRATEWFQIIERYREARPTAWYRENKHLNDKGRETWMTDLPEHPVIRQALYVILALSERGGFDPRGQRELILALSDAVHAIQMLDIADPDVVGALYVAVEPSLPIAELKLTAATGKANPLA